MAVTADVLRSHLAYTAWASQRLVRTVSALSQEELTRDFGTADKSLLGTLVHIFGADRVWLTRLQGESPGAYLTDADYQLSVLQNDWPALHERWRQWAAGLSDDAVLKEVSYKDMRGNPWRQPLWQLVLHVVNHGTHHRGQAAGFLRTLGHMPPQLDLVLYYRDGHP